MYMSLDLQKLKDNAVKQSLAVLAVLKADNV
jgi:hypothetical protein